MKRDDKLAITTEAIKRLPALARTGTFTPATARQPALWVAIVGHWQVSLAENVLLSPIDPALSMLLDVWPAAGGKKVLSVSWMPDKPWSPPRIVQCRRGEWQELLAQSGH
jgi:hypothetical protein